MCSSVAGPLPLNTRPRNLRLYRLQLVALRLIRAYVSDLAALQPTAEQPNGYEEVVATAETKILDQPGQNRTNYSHIEDDFECCIECVHLD